MATARFTVEELTDAAKEYYEDRGWSVRTSFPRADEEFLSKLSRRPELLAKRDGMECLVNVSGRITKPTFALLKQVLFDIEQQQKSCYVIAVCEAPVRSVDERTMKDMGVGLLTVRYEADPVLTPPAQLRCFREPQIGGRLRRGLVRPVREAIRKIREEDVCIGVLDLVQIVERELDKLLPDPTERNQALGRKINIIETNRLLGAGAIKAVKRVNLPRIRRAHPESHAVRKRVIVQPVQAIVDDCLAILMAL